MKKVIYIIVAVIALITLLHETGIAGGIGLYGSWSTGKNFIKHSNSSEIRMESDFDRNVMSYGGGFVADTNLGGTSIFNYRFRLGYDYEVLESDKSCYMNRVMWSNTFGFAVLRDDMVRLWVGPQIGIGYYWGRDVIIMPEQVAIRYIDRSLLNIHLGLVLGLNVNITEHFSLAFEGGMRFNLYHDLEQSNYKNDNRYSRYRDNPSRFENTFPVMGPEGYLSLGFMFRFNEAVVNKEKAESLEIKTKQ